MRTDMFDGIYPYALRFTDTPGFPTHYVDENLTNGEVVLCLHGEPTWGFLFQHPTTVSCRIHRMVVSDYMSFGKSRTPPLYSYWLQDRIDNPERFVPALDLHDLTLVMYDLDEPVRVGLASRHPGRM